jgi:hypothetical protein
MKTKHLFAISLSLLIAMFYSCNGSQDQQSNADSLSQVQTNQKADSVMENKTQEVPVSNDNLLVGKWNYVTSINEIDGMEMKIKVCEKWTMEYRTDGTFSEVQTLDKDYAKDGKYTKTGNKVKREGLIEFEILEIDAKSMTFKAAGIKQVWERVK